MSSEECKFYKSKYQLPLYEYDACSLTHFFPPIQEHVIVSPSHFQPTLLILSALPPTQQHTPKTIRSHRAWRAAGCRCAIRTAHYARHSYRTIETPLITSRHKSLRLRWQLGQSAESKSIPHTPQLAIPVSPASCKVIKRVCVQSHPWQAEVASVIRLCFTPA